MATCQAQTKQGKQCSMPAVGNSEYCFTHSPATKAARQAACRMGGYHRRKKTNAALGLTPDNMRSLASADGVRVILEETLADTLKLDNSSKRTDAIIKVCMAALKIIELKQASELEERLAALEAALSQ